MNVRALLAAVCDYHGIDVARVLRGERGALVSTARTQTCALARHLTCASLQDIADALGMNQCASVHAAIKRHREALSVNEIIYVRDFEAIRARITTAQETNP